MKHDTSNYFLGLPQTTIPGLSTYNVIGRPQTDFEPQYIVIPRSLAPHFLIVDIKIGKESQFVSEAPIPAEIFSGDVVILKDQQINVVSDLPLRMKMDKCRVGYVVCVTIQNLDACAKWFSGVVIGPPLVRTETT